MNIIIAGAGEVGSHAAEVLSTAHYNVTVIDVDAERLRGLSDSLDVRTLHGHCAHFDILQEAGADRADLLIAATQIDEINLLVASMAKTAGTEKTIVRVHHTANFSLRGTAFAEKLGIDELICPEHLTSLAIARTIRNPGSIALEEFGRGQLLMQQLIVSEGAPSIGKALSQIVLPPNVRVATVEREAGPFIADAATVIEKDDLITLIGKRKAFEAARKQFQKGKDKRQYIVILGQTSTAVWLCRALKSRLYSVRLFVHSHDRAEELAQKLSHVTVLEADPTDAAIYVDEHIEKTDVFIAVTEDDEHNILACAQAKTLGATQGIAVVQRSRYMHLLPHVGIDHAFSPSVVAVKAMRNLIDVGPVRPLANFANDVAAVYEVHPSRRIKVIGHELRNIKMPPQVMIAAIRRDDDVFVPGADDQIAKNDTLLIIGPRDRERDLQKLFGTK